MRKSFVLTAGLLAAAAASAQVPVHPRVITFEDFAGMRGVSDPQISPDGKSVLYAVRTTQIAANSRATKTYVAAVSGDVPRPFPDRDAAATEARWSPDGKHIAYVA